MSMLKLCQTPAVAGSVSGARAHYNLETEIDRPVGQDPTVEMRQQDFRSALLDLVSGDAQRRQTGDELFRKVIIIETGDGDLLGNRPASRLALGERVDRHGIAGAKDCPDIRPCAQQLGERGADAPWLARHLDEQIPT